ncbi:SCO3242 family prenyltransferase [Streptomyces sp. NPDC093225]|uniref:SCO3242 family prenyltransferase n=1 Tax=Streptomyces sp. NPDC093225 TaxID=3366034 RepID=UPI0038168AE0
MTAPTPARHRPRAPHPAPRAWADRLGTAARARLRSWAAPGPAAAPAPTAAPAEQVRVWAELLGFGPAAADGGGAGTAPVRRGGPAPVPAAAEIAATGRGAVPAAAVRPAAAPAGHRSPTGRLRAWAELLRLPAVFTVPGDALAGAAAAGVRPGRRTGLAVAASLCLYEAGMALNDWADRDEDAVARPHRPLPSGRIRPGAALAAAGAFTAAGLALAARAGRPALAVAAPLAVTVWAYDTKLKHTPAGPAAMAAARSLDLLLGAAASAGTVRPALRPAMLLGGHTYAVTQVSRREAEGGSTAAPLAALAATTLLAALLGRGPTARRTSAASGPAAAESTASETAASETAASETAASETAASETAATSSAGVSAGRSGATVRPAVSAPESGGTGRPARSGAGDLVRVGMAAGYWRGFAKPLGHAVLNPSPVLTQRAVGGGIRAVIPLQAALMAGSGAPLTGVATVALAPVAARLARKVSTT